MRTIPLALCAALALAASGLPRRGMLGVVVAPRGGDPAVVTSVLEGSAAAAAGFREGDVLLSLDGAPVTGAQPFTRAISRHLGGDTVRIGVRRAAGELVLSAILQPRPLETSPHADIRYETLEVQGARRRAIVARPHREGRMPAVLLMQGLGCYSIDNLPRQDGYGRVLDEFAQRGFVTMRVEKTGEGDSEGIDCSDPRATPDLEAAGYLAALHALKTYDYVDPARIFVFAHSMGPVVGSLAIAREPVAGFIAVETVGTTWFEYDLERLRVQADLSGKTPEEVSEEERKWQVCSFRFYIEKQSPESLAGTPGCSDLTAPFGGAPYTYMQAVADIDLAKNWRTADFPVLVIYGTASPVTTAHQNRYLAEMINRMHPGRASYAEVPGMGHDLNRYRSQDEYEQRNREQTTGDHPFHTGLLDVIFPWLQAQAQ